MKSTVLNLFKSFSKKEKIIFSVVLAIFLITGSLYLGKFIKENTKLIPINSGGFTEGSLGQPIFINPLYAANNPVDLDISKLVFADINNLAEKISQNSDGTEYNIRIKEGAKWHDNQPITTDDIIYTIKTIQDPDSNSPLAASFKGVIAERMSEREFKIILPVKYSYFPEIISSLQPIPKHLFENIPLQNIKLSSYNLEPIGSGPFKFDSFEKKKDGFITKITFKRSDDYIGTKPHLNEFSFNFYTSEDEIIDRFNSGEIDGFAINNPNSAKKITIPHQEITLPMARYYAIFLNPSENPIFRDKNVRTALQLATNNSKITQDLFGDLAAPLNRPILTASTPDFLNQFSIDDANKILEDNGWKMNSEGTRERSDEKLEIALTVYPSPFLVDTAKAIQADWQRIGVKLNLTIAGADDFSRNVLKPRNYEALLFGNTYGNIIDPYSFWSSSQKFAPGLNLSLYENKEADILIAKMRTTTNEDERNSLANNLSNLISQDRPAIFLYSLNYNYIAKKQLRGFENKVITSPSDRFSNIEGWYTRTLRILK